MRALRNKVRKCRLPVIFLSILVIALLAACGGSSDGASAPTATAPAGNSAPQSGGDGTSLEGVRTIEIQTAYVVPYYRSEPIVLKVGEPVLFSISSFDTRHTFTITELGVDVAVTQSLVGETAVSQVITPQEPGTFRIWCRIHTNVPLMEDTLQVVN